MTKKNYLLTFGGRPGANVGKSRVCVYPIVDGPPYGDRPFCDLPSVEDSSYCGVHHKICYQPFDRERAQGFTRFATAVAMRSK